MAGGRTVNVMLGTRQGCRVCCKWTYSARAMVLKSVCLGADIGHCDTSVDKMVCSVGWMTIVGWLAYVDDMMVLMEEGGATLRGNSIRG
jgi:hypothetical protein